MYGLTPFWVGHSHDSCSGHRRMLGQDRLHFHGVHVEASTDDHVFLSIDDEEISILVKIAEISGKPEAVHEFLSSRLRILVIPRNRGSRSETNFADGTNWKGRALIIRNVNFGTGHDP